MLATLRASADPWALKRCNILQIRALTMTIMKICSMRKPVLQLISALRMRMDMAPSLCSSMTPKLGYSWPSSNSDSRILSTSRLKDPLAIDMLSPHCVQFLPVRIITLRAHAEAVELCESCSCNIARQRGPLSPETSKSRSNPGSDHENHEKCIMRRDLFSSWALRTE